MTMNGKTFIFLKVATYILSWWSGMENVES